MAAITSVLYLGELAGARIFAYGSGISQIGTNYQLNVWTWDATPMGEGGTNIFRGVTVTVKSTGAFSLGITPIVDDVSLAEQVFAAGSGQTKCQAVFTQVGARLAAIIRTLSRASDLELENISYTATPIRAFP